MWPETITYRVLSKEQYIFRGFEPITRATEGFLGLFCAITMSFFVTANDRYKDSPEFNFFLGPPLRALGPI